MTKKYLVIAIVLSGFLMAGNAHGQIVDGGFYNAHKYLELRQNDQQKYIMGIWDGTNLSPAFGVSDQNKEWAWYYPCVKKTIQTNKQLLAVIKNYLNAHPEEWNLPMNIIFLQAMQKMCKK